MSTLASRLTPAARCLAALCVLFTAANAARLYAYEGAGTGPALAARESPAPSIDLGAGVLLAHAASWPRAVSGDSPQEQDSIDLVPIGPSAADPATAGNLQPADRVAFLYRGWTLDGRFAAVGLNALYVARWAYARLTSQTKPAIHERAVRIIVPAHCDASADAVIAALRQQVEGGR
jgi:hypothetical protein